MCYGAVASALLLPKSLGALRVGYLLLLAAIYAIDCSSGGAAVVIVLLVLHGVVGRGAIDTALTYCLYDHIPSYTL